MTICIYIYTYIYRGTICSHIFVSNSQGLPGRWLPSAPRSKLWDWLWTLRGRGTWEGAVLEGYPTVAGWLRWLGRKMMHYVHVTWNEKVVELRVWSLDDTHVLSMYYTQVLPPCTHFFPVGVYEPQPRCRAFTRGSFRRDWEISVASVEGWYTCTTRCRKKKCALCIKYERGRYMYSTFYDTIMISIYIYICVYFTFVVDLYVTCICM